jgi:hypothetical protein
MVIGGNKRRADTMMIIRQIIIQIQKFASTPYFCYFWQFIFFLENHFSFFIKYTLKDEVNYTQYAEMQHSRPWRE